MRRFFLFIIFSLVVFCAFAQEKSLYPIAEGKYFSIYGYNGLDAASLLRELNFNYLLNLDSASEKSRDLKSLLADTLDALYLEVSDILDIHMYDFHGKIYIFPEKSYVSKIFENNFGRSFSERSFYLHPKNTIYICFPGCTLGMLGHEISHAIMSHYFVVPPPAKIQEVLAGYVEYSLRKQTGTLP